MNDNVAGFFPGFRPFVHMLDCLGAICNGTSLGECMSVVSAFCSWYPDLAGNVRLWFADKRYTLQWRYGFCRVSSACVEYDGTLHRTVYVLTFIMRLLIIVCGNSYSMRFTSKSTRFLNAAFHRRIVGYIRKYRSHKIRTCECQHIVHVYPWIAHCRLSNVDVLLKSFSFLHLALAVTLSYNPPPIPKLNKGFHAIVFSSKSGAPSGCVPHLHHVPDLCKRPRTR